MVGEIGSMSVNSGSATGLEMSPRIYRRAPGSGVSFTRGSGSGPVQGWARQPAATTLDMSEPAMGGVQSTRQSGQVGHVGQTGNVGDVTLTMNSFSPVQELLHRYFSRYVNDANREAFATLVDNRAAVLEEMGHDAERIRQNMRKANTFDLVTAGVTGAVTAAPFAIASVVLDTVPALMSMANGSPAGEGAIAGAVAGAADVAGCSLLGPSTRNTRWLKADPSRMEPPMQQALQQGSPDLKTQAAYSALGLQTYTARNLLRTAATPLAQSFGGTAARTAVDTVLAAGGGVAAGALTGVTSRYFDQRNGMDGPALLLAHQDWRNLYTQLDTATWTSQAGNALARVGAFPGDVATGTLGAVQSLFTPSGVGEQVLLTTGFSGINAAKQAVVQGATAAGLNPPAAQFLGQVVNTVLSAPLYAALPPVMLGANHFAEVATNAIQSNGWSNTPASAQLLSPATAPTMAPMTMPATTQVAAQLPHTVLDLGDGETSALIPDTGLRARTMQTTEV